MYEKLHGQFSFCDTALALGRVLVYNGEYSELNSFMWILLLKWSVSCLLS